MYILHALTGFFSFINMWNLIDVREKKKNNLLKTNWKLAKLHNSSKNGAPRSDNI